MANGQNNGGLFGFVNNPLFQAGAMGLMGARPEQQFAHMQQANALNQRRQLAEQQLAMDKERLNIMRAKAARGPALPAAMQGYQLAQSQGFPGSFMDYQIGLRSAASPTTTINMPGDDKFNTELAKKAAGRLDTSYEAATKAAESAQNVREAERLLQRGTLAGFGANWLTQGAEILDRLGIAGKDLRERAENTRAYMARAGSEVGQVIQQFGAGTGLSDADREFAMKMAGGDITVTPQALKRIVRIRRQANENIIKRYNRERMRLPETSRRYYERIDIPKYTSPPGEPPQYRPSDVVTGQYKEGDKVRNPQTGEVLVLRNNKWVREGRIETAPFSFGGQ